MRITYRILVGNLKGREIKVNLKENGFEGVV
jgi:hypothetical protein